MDIDCRILTSWHLIGIGDWWWVVSNEIKGWINYLKSSRKEDNLNGNWSKLSLLDVSITITVSMVAWAYDSDW